MKGFILCSVLLMVVMVVGCGKAEVVDIEIEEEVEEISSEKEIVEPDPEPEPLTLFSFIGWTEGELISHFDEDPVYWDDVPAHHIVFNNEEGEKQIFFVFRDGLVSHITAYEGNVLGIEIEGEYDRDLIAQKLGEPTGEGVMNWRDVTLTYMVYYLGEGIHLEFYKNYRAPFSALIVLSHPCLPDYFDWSEEEVLQHLGGKEEIELRLHQNTLVEAKYLEGSEIFGIKIGDKYDETSITNSIGEPINKTNNLITYQLIGIRGGILSLHLKDGYIEFATIKKNINK